MILGHTKQWIFLRKIAETGQLPHAFLFSGPSAIGKKKIAFEFVKMLFCLSRKNNENIDDERNDKEIPCQKCVSCIKINRGVHPDIFVLAAAGERDFSIANIAKIRDLTRHLSLKPLQGGRRIALIDEAHEMRQEAQSALLKTLEEPAGNPIIILISSKPFLLLPAIRSRVQELKFFLLSRHEIEDWLKQKGVPEKRASRIAAISWGRPGRSISFLHPGALEEFHREEEEFTALLGGSISQRFRYAEKIAAEKPHITHYIELWMYVVRKMLVTELSHGEVSLAAGRLMRLLENLQNLAILVSHSNVNIRLALELVFLEGDL